GVSSFQTFEGAEHAQNAIDVFLIKQSS
ncbi:heme-binding protein, partial [Acinetobacter baumannii]